MLENAWSKVGCLMNKKVCHDVTHKDYPNFDLFQDIQSQNNLSTTQLNIMGYVTIKDQAMLGMFDVIESLI
jgi:hypothetical protein